MRNIIKIALFTSILLGGESIIAYRERKKTSTISSKSVKSSNSRKIVTILSIDGGGVRGIIVAKILDYIEKHTNTPISRSFDIMSGTSTGGIIALMLNVPDKETGGAKYSSKRIVDLYRKISINIFKRPLSYRIKTLNGLIGSKYPQEYIKNSLEEYFQDTKMRDAIVKYLIVPVYNLTLEQVWFMTKLENYNEYNDYFMKDVALATSAAPTYFPHVTMDYCYNENNCSKYDFIDSSVVISNPVFSALMSGIHNFDTKCDLFIISIGTGSYNKKNDNTKLDKFYDSGKISWAKRIISLMLDGANKESHMQINDIFLALKNYELEDFAIKHYIRINPEINDAHIPIDGVSSMKDLEKIAEDFIENSKQELDYIVDLINKRNKQYKK